MKLAEATRDLFENEKARRWNCQDYQGLLVETWCKSLQTVQSLFDMDFFDHMVQTKFYFCLYLSVVYIFAQTIPSLLQYELSFAATATLVQSAEQLCKPSVLYMQNEWERHVCGY